MPQLLKFKIKILIFILPLLIFSCDENSNPVADRSIFPSADNGLKILALGDSYTIGESVSERDRWPNQLSDSIKYYNLDVDEVRIVAQTGWTTGDLINAINNQTIQNNYDLVGLLIGVNNQFQGRSLNEYQNQFQQLLENAISFANNDTGRVFVFSIPDYSVTPTGGQFGGGNTAEEIDNFNVVNRQITEQFNVPYFNITPISRSAAINPDLIATDGLHFSGKMYSLWVEFILADILSKLLTIENSILNL